jgi:hypothetical protein
MTPRISLHAYFAHFMHFFTKMQTRALRVRPNSEPLTAAKRYWSKEEHRHLKQLIKLHGHKNAKFLAAEVGKTPAQVRTHWQKWQLRRQKKEEARAAWQAACESLPMTQEPTEEVQEINSYECIPTFQEPEVVDFYGSMYCDENVKDLLCCVRMDDILAFNNDHYFPVGSAPSTQ